MSASRAAALAIATVLLGSSSLAFADDDAKADDAAAADKAAPSQPKDEPKQEDTAKKPAAVAKKQSRPKAPNRRATSGLGFQLTVGGLAALRRMEFAGTVDTIKHAPKPYLGGVVRATQALHYFSGSGSHLLAEVEGGYATSKDSGDNPTLGRPLVTEHTYFDARAVFEKPLRPTLDLDIGLGAIATSFIVEPNPRYTGHRYLAVVASFGATHYFDGPYRVNAALTLFPGISTNQSNGAYGRGRSFGGRGEISATWRFLQPDPNDEVGSTELTARYTYSRFRSNFPETQIVGDRAGSNDDQHVVSLMLGYSL